MKSLLILGVTLAACSVLANPIQKKAEVTDFVFETVYVTVTPEITSETPSSTSQAPAPSSTSTSSQDVQNEQQSQPSSTASQSSDATSSSATKAISSDYTQGILDAHNNHRLNHSAPGLTWSPELASIAQQIGQSCVYAHETKTGGGGYGKQRRTLTSLTREHALMYPSGQNIGAGAPPNEIPAMITNAMYNDEIGLYPGYGGEPDMSNFHKWGHFSQIVWKNTQEVGCATVYCPGGLANTGSNVSPYFTVCNYKPAGNFAGQYGENVQRPNGMATISL